MNAVIAVSGSSPACLYRLAALTCGYAEQRGIDREAALELFCQTLKGSADMLLKSGKTPQALIDMVTSKGGTTFALLDVLDQKDFDGRWRLRSLPAKNRRRSFPYKGIRRVRRAYPLPFWFGM